MNMLRNFSSSDACSSTVSMLFRASHACPCLINCLSTVRHFAAQAAYAHDSSSDEEECLAASSTTMHRQASTSFRHSKLLWQQVSGITTQQAQQLLQQQPFLEPILQTAFHHSNLSSNISILQSRGYDTQQPMSEQLRAYLSLVPPRLLQEIAGRWGQAATSQLPTALSHLAYRLDRQQKYQQQQHMQQSQQQLWQWSQPAAEQIGQLLHVLDHVPQRQQQHQQLTSPSPMQQLAAAVTEALGLRDQPIPDGLRVDEDLVRQAARHSSSSRGRSSQRDHSPVRQHYSSSSRSYHTAVKPVTYEQYLATALERTSNAVHLRGKEPPSSARIVQQLQQVQQQSGMSAAEVYQLLVNRPGLLWSMTQSPGSVLQLLEQRLPALAASAAAGTSRQRQQQQVTVIEKLLMQNPTLLTVSEQQAAEALALLLDRLRLTPDEAAAAVAANPKLLLNPVKDTSLNLGFLVGLGFRPADLKQMVVSSPKWVTRQLRDITLNWKFITSAAMVTVADVVHFPELLSLSIISRLGPRLAYARKRGVKLLLPSHARLLPDLSQDQWSEHKLIPLDVWLTREDKSVCKVMGLSLEDYTRFKHAWARVDGAVWKQASSSRGSIKAPAA